MSADKMTDDEKLQELEEQRAVICEEIKRLNNQASKLYDEITPLKDKIFERELAKSDQPNWPLLLKEQDSMVMYKALDKALAKYGMMSFGYRPLTMQHVVKISLYKYAPDRAAKLEKTFDGLQKLLPYIEPIEGWRIISILESTLSELGSYNLYVSEKVCEIRKTTHCSERTIFESKSLREVLEYIQENLSYDSPECR